MKSLSRIIGVTLAVLLVLAGTAAAQDSLAAARQLYASASYDEALAMLDRLSANNSEDPSVAVAIEQYRAFCLLAIGRQADAERAVARVVAGDPTFRPTDSEVSPRLQSFFRDVRTRTLPTVVRARYADAKAAYDQKDYPVAATKFAAVVKLLETPDVVAADASLGDLRTVAVGFRDLAHAATPPPPPAAPAPAPAPVAAPPAYYTADDASVTAPVVVRQDLPRLPAGMTLPTDRGRRAVLDIVIDANGSVESAAVRPSIVSWYDALLVESTRNWRYKPATKDGQPVKFRKAIIVVADK